MGDDDLGEMCGPRAGLRHMHRHTMQVSAHTSTRPCVGLTPVVAGCKHPPLCSLNYQLAAPVVSN